MEEPISLSDTEDFSLQDTDLMQNSKDNQDYLIMTIELGDGQQQHIKIHASDDPQLLAHDFIQTHQLNPDLEQSLAMLIKQNLGLLDKRSQPSPFLKSSLSNYQSMTKDNFKVFDSPSPMKHTPTLNKKSIEIVSKQSRNGDIHERLYRLAKKKKPKVQEVVQSVSEKSASCYFNPGEILYIKGMAMQHSKLRLTEERVKERQALEAKELTFKPNINPSQSRYEERPEDVLLKKAKDYEAHKIMLKEKFAKEEIKECSFKPNAFKNKEGNAKVHEELYKEAQKRQEKQMELSNMKLFSFEPNADRPRTERKPESKEEFIDRLFNSKKKLQEEMEKLRELQEKDYDPTTGQKFFKPQTLFNSEASMRKRDKVIWEYLYDMKDSKKENIKKILEEEETHWQESAKQSKVGNQSLKVFEKFRYKQYKKLFSMLDSNQDGEISADHIELGEMSEKHLEILSPLLEHLLKSGDTMGFEAFSMHLEELRSHLDLHTRSYLFKRDKKVEVEEIDPHPQLNPHTLEIAERLKTEENIYDRQVKRKIIAKLKLEKRKEMQEESVVKDCSFRPTLISNERIR